MPLIGLVTTEGLGNLMDARNNEGWFVYPTKFSASATAGDLNVSRTIDDINTQFYIGLLSQPKRLSNIAMEIIGTIPAGENGGVNTVIAELYYFGESEPHTFSINTGTNQITIPTTLEDILTANGQRVTFRIDPEGSGTLPVTTLGSIVAGQTYFIRDVGTQLIKVYPTKADAIANTNAYDFTTAGSGDLRIQKEFMFALAQPDEAINYIPSMGNYTLRPTIVLANSGDPDLFEFNYTQAYDISTHNTDPNSHENLPDDAANVGTGEGGLFRDITSRTINIKTLKQGSNITVTNNANDVTIAAASGSLSVSDEGASQGTATSMNFVGAGVSVGVSSGIATVTIPGGISGISVKEEGGASLGSATIMNFVGNGITVAFGSGTATVTVGTASSAEINAGTVDDKYITPAGLAGSRFFEPPAVPCEMSGFTSFLACSVYTDDPTINVNSASSLIQLSTGLLVRQATTGRGPIAYNSGTLQEIDPDSLTTGLNCSGVMIKGGYIYAYIIDTGSSAEIWRCLVTADISNAGNWTKLTISGTSLGTAAGDGLVGYGNGKFWVVKGSGFVPYTLSGTTLTSSTTVTVTSADYKHSRVNETGIYAAFSSEPKIRFADFTGALTATKQVNGTGSASALVRFALPHSFYLQISDGNQENGVLTRINF
jgi:hypothetical protein